MHATLHAVRRPVDGDPQDVVRDCLPTGAQPTGSILLASVADPGGTVLALWADEDAARAAAERIYRVTDEFSGRSAGRSPLFASLTWLNGSGNPAQADAAEHGGRNRIWPAVREIDGIVTVLALRSTDDRIVVAALTTAMETHTAVGEAVQRTELLPDEDPALLPGADRIEPARVLLAQLPTEVRS